MWYLIISIILPQFIFIFIRLMISQPFPSRFYEEKYKKYFFNEDVVENHPDLMVPPKTLETSARDLFNLILGLSLSIYMLMGFYSIIYSIRRLMRPGVSFEMRKLFIKKHASYVIFLILIWLLQLLLNYYQLFKNPNVDPND